ncbi:transposase [Streptomyces sp. NPDC058876]|uniref:transposase n=1 Tax=unclassified Streptomyces TaxID=2593676 RepID=UPI0036A24C08
MRRHRRIRTLPTPRAIQRDRIVPELRRIRRLPSHQDTLPQICKIHCQSVHTAGGTSLVGNPRHHDNIARKLARAQRQMARRHVKGARQQSKGFQDARDRVARLQAQLAARRVTGLHLISKRLVQQYSEIALETLNTKGMTRSAKGTLDRPSRNVRASRRRGWAPAKWWVAWRTAIRRQACSPPCQAINRRSAVIRPMACGPLPEAGDRWPELFRTYRPI